MRNNGPVNNREVVLSAGEDIVSATDTRGIITFCNDDFCKISGFDRNELIGQPHNMVRHPDMPPAAFEMLWKALKKGDPWMGLVKNRTKDGGFYWVSAYVTPLKDKGQVVGYESVRSKPTRECVDRAIEVYARINTGKPALSFVQRWLPVIQDVVSIAALILLLLWATLFFAGDGDWMAYLGSAVAAVFAAGIIYRIYTGYLAKVKGLVGSMHEDPFAAYLYTGRMDVIGQLALAQLAQKARLDTALGRFIEAAQELRDRSRDAEVQAHQASDGMRQQQQETVQVPLYRRCLILMLTNINHTNYLELLKASSILPIIKNRQQYQ